MENPLQRPWRQRLFQVLGGQLAILLIIGGLVSWQVHRMETKIVEMADLKDPSPFTARLVGILGQINVNLVQFVQSRQKVPLEALISEEKQFEDALNEFQRLNPRLIPAGTRDQILSVFITYKQALSEVLQANYQQADRWDKLMTVEDQMIFLVDFRLHPLILPKQKRAAEREQRLLELTNELRGVPKDLTQYVLRHASKPTEPTGTHDQKFRAALARYQGVALLAPEKEALARVAELWDENVATAKDIVRLEQVKNDAFHRLTESQNALRETIDRLLPAVRPEVIEEKKRSISHSVTLIIGLIAVLIVGGILSLAGAGIWAYRLIRGRAAGDGPPDIVVGMSLEGTIGEWSPGATAFYGYAAEEARGKSIGMLFASEQEIRSLYDKMKHRHDTSFRTTHVDKDGRSHAVQVQFLQRPADRDQPALIELHIKPL